ncbi:MAG: M23 family metallopeptidase [Myxococcota bacterium]
MTIGRFTLTYLVVTVALCSSPDRAASGDYRLFDSAPVWPLCGHISKSPPPGWSPAQGCPSERWGDPDHTDYPLTTTFGPRLLLSTGEIFDFHRGIDIPTEPGTPVFAMTRGVVRIAGEHPSFSDPLVQIRHFRPERWGDCRPDGCYYSIYLHMSGWVVSEGQVVEKGQHIGYTGVSSAGGNAHLHFEIRDAQPEDPLSVWQRDAIHPLRLMPYRGEPGSLRATIVDVDAADPMRPIVQVDVSQPGTVRTMDLSRVEVEIYDNNTRTSVAQPGRIADGNGYHVHPPFFDLERHNRQYTHKDSSGFPWAFFASCPFAHDHPADYNANIHLCNHDPNDERVGVFNGVRVQPARFNSPGRDYQLTVDFTQLTGVVDAADLCVVVNVRDARGGYGTPDTWNCSF